MTPRKRKAKAARKRKRTPSSTPTRSSPRLKKSRGVGDIQNSPLLSEKEDKSSGDELVDTEDERSNADTTPAASSPVVATPVSTPDRDGEEDRHDDDLDSLEVGDVEEDKGEDEHIGNRPAGAARVNRNSNSNDRCTKLVVSKKT